MDLNQRLDVLAAVPLFSQVGKRDLERLASSVTERQFAAGTEIVKEGEIGVAMFVIAKGEVEAVKGDGGSEVHVADIGAGGYFGEMALFEHFPRNATIRAKGDVECLAITEWDLQAELRSTPEIAVQLLKSVLRRLRAADSELASLKGGSTSVE